MRKIFRKYNLFFLLATVFIFTQSCTPSEPEKDWEKVYFSVTDLINNQVAELQAKPSLLVKKDISFEEEIKQVYDSLINWEEELKIYATADLNKPVLTGVYTIVGSKEENKVTYTANASDLEVQKMEVLFYEGNPTKITILQKTENMLYKTQRILTLELKDAQLTNYAVEETQKLLFRNAVDYKLSASLIQ